MNTYKRDLVLDATRADKKQRRVPAVISTEFPVSRDGYEEILLHSPDNVDLSRAPLPLIESHDGRRLNIGLVENLKLAGGKLRGDIVFGNSERANELWPDVEAGIVRNLSIGYVINSQRIRGETVEVTRWQPFETSLVSIPADPTAGTYRNITMQNNDDILAIESRDSLSRSQRRAQNAGLTGTLRESALENERIVEIREIQRAYRGRLGLTPEQTDSVADQAVDKGLTVKQFQDALLGASEGLAKMRTITTNVDPRSSGRSGGFKERQFSVARAIGGMIDPRGVDCGFERECSQEMARQLGRQPQGFYMPIGRLSERTLSVAGTPDLVGESHLGNEFIDALRARSFVMGLGPRILSGLTMDVSIPRLTASASSGWIAGDGSDGLTASDPTVDSVKLTPKTVGALTVLSRKMILQGDPETEQMVRDDFAKLIATELDRAAINGSGASNQPTGIINTLGVSTGTYALGGASFAKIVEMESALMANSADFGSLAYLTTPALSGSLKLVEKSVGSGQFVWTSGRERGVGEMNGFPAYASSNVPLDNIILGNWSDLLMGLWGAIDIAVDPYHDFAKGTVAVRIFTSVDFAVRHPESFVVYNRAAS